MTAQQQALSGNGQDRALSEYYVAPHGHDGHDAGGLDRPFQRIGFALQQAKPGCTIWVREGIYNEKVLVSKSGESGRPIILKAYSDEKPVIDGTGLTVTGKEALITVRNARFVEIDGFEVCRLTSAEPNVMVNGITVEQGSEDIVIRNNRIYNIENQASPEEGRNGHGIEIIGNTDVPLKNILVEGNEIHDCKTGFSENLTINGYVDGFIIRNNTVYNGENIGIVAAGGYAANPVPAFNYARNGVICDNEVYNMDGTSGPIPAYQRHNGAIGIYVDGARQVIVERNKVYDNGRGIGIVSETEGYPTENGIVRNNFVYNNALSGIYLGGYVGYTTGGTINCAVVNNTLYANSRDLGYFDEVEGEIRLTENCAHNVIMNNLIVARPDRGLFINKQSQGGSDNAVDYNLYYSENLYRWAWNGEGYTDFNEWRSACLGDAHSIVGQDPLFADRTIPDIRIAHNSPARHRGVMLSPQLHGATDIHGAPRLSDHDHIDIGAEQIKE